MSNHRKSRKHSKPGKPSRARAQQLPAPEPQPPAPEPRLIYQCEAIAYDPDHSAAYPLGSYPAASPRLALRWIVARARDLVDQLDPPATQPTRHWLADEHHHEHALRMLAHGQAYAHTIHSDDAHYVLSAQPIQTTEVTRAVDP